MQTKTVKLKTTDAGGVSLAPPAMHPGYHKDHGAVVVAIERVPAHLPTAAVLTAYRNAAVDVSFDGPYSILWDDLTGDRPGHRSCGSIPAERPSDLLSQAGASAVRNISRAGVPNPSASDPGPTPGFVPAPAKTARREAPLRVIGQARPWPCFRPLSLPRLIPDQRWPAAQAGCVRSSARCGRPARPRRRQSQASCALHAVAGTPRRWAKPAQVVPSKLVTLAKEGRPR